MADRIVAVCTIAVAAGYLYATAGIPSLDIGDPLGPKAFPMLLGVAMLLASLLLLIEAAGTSRTRRGRGEAPVGERRPLALVGAVAAASFISIALLEPLGFILSTALYLFGLTAYFNRNRWWTNAAVAIGFPIAVYALFVKVLGVALAKGVLSF